MSRLRSKSRSEISSLGYRVPLMHEKMRSASNPCTDFFYAKSRYPLFERYVSSEFYFHYDDSISIFHCEHFTNISEQKFCKLIFYREVDFWAIVYRL